MCWQAAAVSYHNMNLIGVPLEMCHYLVENRIMIGDIHYNNILIRRDSEGGMTPVIVDGIGDRVAITILNAIPKFTISKIIRRWNRFSRKQLDSNALLDENNCPSKKAD